MMKSERRLTLVPARDPVPSDFGRAQSAALRKRRAQTGPSEKGPVPIEAAWARHARETIARFDAEHDAP